MFAVVRPSRRPCLATLFAAGLLVSAAGAWAQFAMVPAPLAPSAASSEAGSDRDYRADAAKHLYATYPMRVYKGRMPPLLYGVAIIETDVDAAGNVVNVRIRRPPAAPEIGPWIQQMIRRASPFPALAKMEKATYVDIWLVHRGGNFQLDTLTEGQD